MLILSCRCLCRIHWSHVSSREWRCVVGAAPTNDAPTTSEWSTSLLPTKVWLILEVWLVVWALTVKLPTGECHRSSPMINQHWFRLWLGAIRQQPITQCTTLNIFNNCHLGYLNLLIYSPNEICHGHVVLCHKKVRRFNSHLGYKILKSHSPQDFFIALAMGPLLKSHTEFTSANFDPDLHYHMVSLGHNGFINIVCENSVLTFAVNALRITVLLDLYWFFL